MFKLKYLLFILLFLPSLSFSGVSQYQDLDFSKKIVYEKKTNLPFTGLAELKDLKGELIKESYYKKGIRKETTVFNKALSSECYLALTENNERFWVNFLLVKDKKNGIKALMKACGKNCTKIGSIGIVDTQKECLAIGTQWHIDFIAKNPPKLGCYLGYNKKDYRYWYNLGYIYQEKLTLKGISDACNSKNCINVGKIGVSKDLKSCQKLAKTKLDSFKNLNTPNCYLIYNNKNLDFWYKNTTNLDYYKIKKEMEGYCKSSDCYFYGPIGKAKNKKTCHEMTQKKIDKMKLDRTKYCYAVYNEKKGNYWYNLVSKSDKKRAIKKMQEQCSHNCPTTITDIGASTSFDSCGKKVKRRIESIIKKKSRNLKAWCSVYKGTTSRKYYFANYVAETKSQAKRGAKRKCEKNANTCYSVSAHSFKPYYEPDFCTDKLDRAFNKQERRESSKKRYNSNSYNKNNNYKYQYNPNNYTNPYGTNPYNNIYITPSYN